MNTLDLCLSVTLPEEGGWADNPHDPGAATMEGVTQRVYDAWRHSCGLPFRSVREIEPSERDAIYKTQYFDPIKGAELTPGVAITVFDYAVNSGVYRAAIALQWALGVKMDGQIGLLTLHAASQDNASHIIEAVCGRRLSFLERLRTWRWFGRGWSARVHRVEAKALRQALIQ